LAIRFPKSVAEAIEQKFHLAATLKAEQVLRNWALTKTAKAAVAINKLRRDGFCD
jgi:hypothetical protein